jgi:uncharacterized protein (TIGR02246 family)
MDVAKTPADVDKLFEKALAAHDLEAIIALYEEGAVVPGQQGTAIGLDQIREAMRPFVDLKPTNVSLNPTVVAEIGDIAILYDDWSGTGHTPDGQTIPLNGKAIELVRRQADGTWKFIFDDPNARG